MRDKRKSEDYFNSYIDYQKNRISKKISKLSGCLGNSMKAERVNQSLLKYKMDMVYAQFSVGIEKRGLLICFEDALKTALQVKDFDFETLLNLLSLAVILEEKRDISNFIVKYNHMIRNDKLLNCLAKYIEKGKFVWQGKFIIKGVYDGLDNLGDMTDKERVLYNYLLEWYATHKDFAWYDSHKNEKDTYVGYWSFESAALAKIIGVNQRKLENNEYYPSI